MEMAMRMESRWQAGWKSTAPKHKVSTGRYNTRWLVRSYLMHDTHEDVKMMGVDLSIW